MHLTQVACFQSSGMDKGFAAALAAIALSATCAIAPAHAQEIPTMTADADANISAPNRDGALLAALGLDLATLEQAGDTALLWHAVRELVLPGKVSEETQRRILRRVWIADPAMRDSSFIDLATH